MRGSRRVVISALGWRRAYRWRKQRPRRQRSRLRFSRKCRSKNGNRFSSDSEPQTGRARVPARPDQGRWKGGGVERSASGIRNHTPTAPPPPPAPKKWARGDDSPSQQGLAIAGNPYAAFTDVKCSSNSPGGTFTRL